MPRQLRLLLSVFVSGAVVMALELLASRLLAPVFGNSIFVWGSLIGVVLAALACGYYLGGRLADRSPHLEMLSMLIFGAGLVVVALPMFAPPTFDFVLRLGLGDRYSPLMATVVLLGLPSLLLGMVSPFAVRLGAMESFEKVGKVSGNVYALSTLGSIVGTFFTVFVLIPEFGVNKIILVLGVALLIAAFLGLGLRLKVFVLIVLLVLPFASPFMVSHRLTIAAYSSALGDTVYEMDTPYHHLLVADSVDAFGQSNVRFLILDDNFHSAMDLKDPDRAVFAYTDYFHLGFLLNPSITRVLFIGGGGFTGPKSFLRHYPSVLVDVAEIDPVVVNVAKEYFGVDGSNPRLRVYSEDGRIFLQKSTEVYDLIVLDAYSKSYVPFHLMTVEFFKDIVRHLTTKGVVISNLISRVSVKEAQLLSAETNTMKVLFPNVYSFAVRGASFPDLQNVLLLATVMPNHLNKSDFQNLAFESSVSGPPSLRDQVSNYFMMESSNLIVLTDNFAPVETLLNPMTGEPIITGEESSLLGTEMTRVLVILLFAAVAFLILRRKRIL